VDDRRTVRVAVYPASVDPESLARTMASPERVAARGRFRPGEGPTQLIARVDRLDPSKNQLRGFQAFDRLLEVRPDLRGRVRFLAFLVPSRTDLGVYRDYRDAILGTVAAINDRWAAACDGPPIEVFYTNDREQALVGMECADVLLVNSLADGMNLVAKEWAMVSRRPGVLVVSETTGVADEVGDAALRVSPLDVEGTARALADAVSMPVAERMARLSRLRAQVRAWTARDWLTHQLADLKKVGDTLKEGPTLVRAIDA
jgi:trehalose 6-phosphate synthase